MSLIRFLFSFSFFIALCAAGLSYQTFLLLDIRVDTSILGIIFLSTLAAYNFYWILSKWHYQHKKKLVFLFRGNLIHFAILIFSGGAMLCLSQTFLLLSYLLVAFLLTLLYCIPYFLSQENRMIKKMGFSKTLILSVTWSFVTIIIPAQSLISVHPNIVFCFFVSRFLFVLMLCIIFDKRDTFIDVGKATLNVVFPFSVKQTNLMMTIILVLYLLVTVSSSCDYLEFKQSIVLILSGIAAYGIYFLSFKKRGYYFYYFWVDGLMLFSALATFLISIRSFI